MIQWQRIFHTGIRVHDLDVAMVEMGESMGVTWATVQHSDDRAVWTPEDGLQHVPLTFVYSCEGPQHIELLESPAPSPWHAGDSPGVHHVGLWVDDVAAATERCLAAGWSVAAAGAPPDDGYGAYTYVVPPSGPIVELVLGAVEPMFEHWWAGGTLGSERD